MDTLESAKPFLEGYKAAGRKVEEAPVDELFARPQRATMQYRELSDWFLVAALCLLPLDIWLRRRTWRA